MRRRGGMYLEAYAIVATHSPTCSTCRYNEILLMVETCQAATLIEKVAAPNIVATASSVRGIRGGGASVDKWIALVI